MPYIARPMPMQCLSLTFVYCIDKHNLELFPAFEPHNSSFSIRNIMAKFWRVPHNGDVECRWCMKKARFATNISLYLGNYTKYGHSYYLTPIGKRMSLRFGHILRHCARYKSTHYYYYYYYLLCDISNGAIFNDFEWPPNLTPLFNVECLRNIQDIDIVTTQ